MCDAGIVFVDSRARLWSARILAGAAVAGIAGLGWGLAGVLGLTCGGFVGVVAYGDLFRWLRRGASRRRDALSRPFPSRWRTFLLDHYAYYSRLPRELRDRFEDDIKIFLADKRITGIHVKLNDELRLLTAASAVTLSLGWPEFRWRRLTEVLLYPDDFDRDYSFERDDLAGLAHPWGTVILSVPSLWNSFEYPADARHVGIHEFAHLLDLEQAQWDGVPTGLGSRQAEQWVSVIRTEMKRLQRGDAVMDPYGADDPVEFLAVSVEAFFEIPARLKAHHPELYSLLATYFQQDPASREYEHGG
jgi:Mlc titration factor MtfA (ptsG expression regulator)